MNVVQQSVEAPSPHEPSHELASLIDEVREVLQTSPLEVGHAAHLLGELLTAADDIATVGDHSLERQLRNLAAALENGLFHQ